MQQALKTGQFNKLVVANLCLFYSQKLHRIYQILVYNFVCCVRNASNCVQIVCGHGIWWFGLFISINITFHWKIHQGKYWDTDRRQVFVTKLYQTPKKVLIFKGMFKCLGIKKVTWKIYFSDIQWQWDVTIGTFTPHSSRN